MKNKWKPKVRAALSAMRSGEPKLAEDILVRSLSGEKLEREHYQKSNTSQAIPVIHRSGGGHGSKR